MHTILKISRYVVYLIFLLGFSLNLIRAEGQNRSLLEKIAGKIKYVQPGKEETIKFFPSLEQFSSVATFEELYGNIAFLIIPRDEQTRGLKVIKLYADILKDNYQANALPYLYPPVVFDEMVISFYGWNGGAVMNVAFFEMEDLRDTFYFYEGKVNLVPKEMLHNSVIALTRPLQKNEHFRMLNVFKHKYFFFVHGMFTKNNKTEFPVFVIRIAYIPNHLGIDFKEEDFRTELSDTLSSLHLQTKAEIIREFDKIYPYKY